MLKYTWKKKKIIGMVARLGFRVFRNIDRSFEGLRNVRIHVHKSSMSQSRAYERKEKIPHEHKAGAGGWNEVFEIEHTHKIISKGGATHEQKTNEKPISSKMTFPKNK